MKIGVREDAVNNLVLMKLLCMYINSNSLAAGVLG